MNKCNDVREPPPLANDPIRSRPFGRRNLRSKVSEREEGTKLVREGIFSAQTASANMIEEPSTW